MSAFCIAFSLAMSMLWQGSYHLEYREIKWAPSWLRQVDRPGWNVWFTSLSGENDSGSIKDSGLRSPSVVPVVPPWGVEGLPLASASFFIFQQEARVLQHPDACVITASTLGAAVLNSNYHLGWSWFFSFYHWRSLGVGCLQRNLTRCDPLYWCIHVMQ